MLPFATDRSISPADRSLASTTRRATALLIAIAASFALIHILTNGRYGFDRDELQFLSDARHLDWGFVAYPPFTPFIERIGFSLFGLSLVGLRLFSVLAQAIVIVVSGLMARDLGGNRLAQVTTALSVGLSGLPIIVATDFQYTSFSYLWWTLVCWFTIRLLKSENPRWWIAIGTAIGLGLLTKYSIAFFIAGLLAGLILTYARSYLRSMWLWCGVAIALFLFLPNIVWLIRHDFISYHMLQHIHARDVGEGRADGYWTYQFLVDVNPFAAPLWIAGLIAFFLSSRYRMLAWMYVSRSCSSGLTRDASTTSQRRIQRWLRWARSLPYAGLRCVPPMCGTESKLSSLLAWFSAVDTSLPAGCLLRPVVRCAILP